MLDIYNRPQGDGHVSFDVDDLAAVGYVSSSTQVLGLLGLTHLFLQSYWNNRRWNLTGRLYYDGVDFGLILEGEKTQLARLARVIERDGRHKIRQKRHIEDITQRHYDDWQMRFDGAGTVARVLPNYSHAIGESHGEDAGHILQLMTLYQV